MVLARDIRVMKNHLAALTLAGCLVAAITCVASEPQPLNETLKAEIAKVATIQKPLFEDTKRARNTRLNELFREYVQSLGGPLTKEAVAQFNAHVKQTGLTNFDDFLKAQTTPLKYVKDPLSGDKVPVFGPLGSDVVNSWLSKMKVSDGRPLQEQPMYRLASDALSEHLDFAIMGVRDPNLSMALLPPELRANAELAYKRLNPNNEFDGGFDHPLYYATIREAAGKLFCQDYPKARLSMADIVVPEEQGGFGIESCLLCHDRSHNDVYKRLLAQSYLSKAKAKELRDAKQASSSSAPADANEASEELKQAEAAANDFQLAAQRVLESHPNQINSQSIKESLAALTRDNTARFMPGYDEFQATLEKTGCLKCHGTGANPPPTKNPAKYNAFVLNTSPYFKSRNVNALLKVVNLDELKDSVLLRKAGGMVSHRGKSELLLDEAGLEDLHKALHKWIYPFEADPAALNTN
jgi:hypothetical protein